MTAAGPAPQVRLIPVTSALATRLRADAGAATLPAHPGWPHDGTPHALDYVANRGACGWLVQVDGLVVGDVGTKGPPDPAGRVEIGYGLAAGARGRGVGTAAVRLALAHLFADPHVQVVMAAVHRDNTASTRLLERLGFTPYDAVPGRGDDEIGYALARGVAQQSPG